MDTTELNDKEVEWTLFLLQNPEPYEFIKKFREDYEAKMLPKNKAIAKKLTRSYGVHEALINYYKYCDFKDEDRELYNRIKEYPHFMALYIREIDAAAPIKMSAMLDNIQWIGIIYYHTHRGFDIFERIVKNKIVKKEPTIKQIQAIRDHIMLAPRMFILDAIKYLETTDFGEKKYITDFIVGSLKEQLKYQDARR
jgi:hypothetical protein